MDGRRSENGNKGQVKKIDVASKLAGERERERERQTDRQEHKKPKWKQRDVHIG